MCDYGGPGLGQLKIASLEVGDVIRIKAGTVPSVEEDTADTVTFADGFKAVTAGGITLYARHGYGVEKLED